MKKEALPMSEKKQVSSEMRRLLANKGMALAELCWKLITEAGFGASTAFKIRDRDPFSALTDGEKMGVAKVAISFLKGSDEITKVFDEKIAKQAEAEAEAARATEEDDIEEAASASEEAADEGTATEGI
jgi:hypothetical protein